MEDVPEFIGTDNNGTDNGKDWHDAAGKFARGNPGKPKGSSKNKLRDEIKSFLSAKWSEFPRWFNELDSRQKIDVVISLLPYSVARLQAAAMTDSEGRDIEPKATIDYTKLSESALKEVLSATRIEETQ